jgi:hypothetical protein
LPLKEIVEFLYVCEVPSTMAAMDNYNIVNTRAKIPFQGKVAEFKNEQQNMGKHLGRDCPLEGSPIFF